MPEPPTLPPGYSARPPVRDDADAVARVLTASRAAHGDTPVNADEIRDDWHEVDLATEAIALIAPDGTMAAYADLADRAGVTYSIYGYVDPTHRGRGLGRALIDWGEAHAIARLSEAPPGAQVVVQHYIDRESGDALALLDAAGYPAIRQTWVMAIDLDRPPRAPVWPAGIGRRPYVVGRDERATFEAVEEAFRDLWGRPPGTFERFLELTRSDGFDPGLIVTAVDGDEIVGVAMGKIASGEGWIHTVGVRRPWRRHGVGLALLQAIFAEYEQRGIRRVELSVDGKSLTGAPRLYGRAGMWLRRTYLLCRKIVRPGYELTAPADQAE